MIRLRWAGWRRDLLVAVLASLITAAVLVPLGRSAARDQRDQIEAARRMAEAAAVMAERQREHAQRNLIEEAADVVGLGGKGDAEVFRISSDAVAPEIPEGALALLDR